MIDFINDLHNLFGFIDFDKILMFMLMTFASLLMLVAIVKIGSSLKDFTEKVVNTVLADIKSIKNQRNKKR